MNDAAVFVSAECGGGEAGPDASEVTQHPLLGRARAVCGVPTGYPDRDRLLARPRVDRKILTWWKRNREVGQGTALIDTAETKMCWATLSK